MKITYIMLYLLYIIGDCSIEIKDIDNLTSQES